MLERLSKTRRNLALALIGALVLWFAWTVRAVLNPMILGYLLAFVVHPMVMKLEARGWKRRSAVNVIFATSAVAAVLLSGLVFVQGRTLYRDLTRGEGVAPRIERGLTQLFELVKETSDALDFSPEEEDEGGGPEPEGLEGPPGSLDPGSEDPGSEDPGPGASADAEASPVGGEILPPERSDTDFVAAAKELWTVLSDRLQAEGALESAGSGALQAAGGLWSVVRRGLGGLFSIFALLTLLPIYTYFLLFELDGIHGFVRRYLPRRDRERLASIGGKIGEVLANFFRGRLLVCFLKGLLLTAGLWIAGIPYAFLLGMGSGFLSLVPFFGPFLGFVVAFLLGLIEHSPLGALIRVGIVFSVGEVIEGYVFLPKILGDSLGLHPFVVLASVMVGGAALGMFGALIAIPLAAVLIIVVRELVLPALRAFADEEETAETG